MRNRLQKLILSRVEAITNRRNGKHPNASEISMDSQKQPLWKRLLGWFRHLHTRKPWRWFTYPGWRKDPLKAVNQMLFTLAIVMTVAAPWYLRYESSKLSTELQLPISEVITAPQKAEAPVETRASFAHVAAGRRYFRMPLQERANENRTPVNASEIPTLAQRFTLLGVLMGDEPQAIVHDNSSNTSLFLSKGHHLNGCLVQQILEDGIILLQDGEQIELRL